MLREVLCRPTTSKSQISGGSGIWEVTSSESRNKAQGSRGDKKQHNPDLGPCHCTYCTAPIAPSFPSALCRASNGNDPAQLSPNSHPSQHQSIVVQMMVRGKQHRNRCYSAVTSTCAKLDVGSCCDPSATPECPLHFTDKEPSTTKSPVCPPNGPM